MLASELELPAFDHTDPALRGARYREAMARLQGHDGWLAACPFGYIVLTRESAELFLRSRRTAFPGLTIAELFGIDDGPLHEEIVRNIINLGGDDHRRLRNLVNPALSPRAVERYRPAMRAYLAELLDAVPSDGRVEFLAAVAKPYPSLVIAHIMARPPVDRRLADRLYEWSNVIQRQFDPASLSGDRPRIEAAVAEFYAWADELIARRRAAPGDDLITDLIAAHSEGDRLSDDELRNLVLNVLVGGVDTSQSQLAHAVRLLAEHPDQWRALRSDPERLAPAAVEEALRYEPITPFTARIATEEIEHRGVTFPPGSVVLVSAWHANREGREVDRFDIAADRGGRGAGGGGGAGDRGGDGGGGRILTFGAGIHYCVGANLARAEIAEGLAALAARYERVELDGAAEYGTPSGIYGLERLPLRLS